MSVRGNVDFHLSDEVNGWIDASATFYDVRGDNSNFWASSATLRPERLTPLIPIDMIDPLDKNSLNLAAASGNIIDGKYLLGGSQENPTNPLPECMQAATTSTPHVSSSLIWVWISTSTNCLKD